MMAMSTLARLPGRPGIDRPIEVGQLMGVCSGGCYTETSMHTSGSIIQSILANPITTPYPLGPTATIPVPPKGFVYQAFGDTGTNNTQTGGPTAAEISAFISALDNLDVVIIHGGIQIMSDFSAPQEAAFQAYWDTAGVITSGRSTDDNKLNVFPAWDSLQAAVYQNSPSSDRAARLFLDTLDRNSSRYGYLDSALGDTTFTEQWLSFTTSSATIRAQPYLHVVLDIDEGSYVGGLGGAASMAPDHPVAWYRTLPTGGRFFYTSIGHESQNMTIVTNRFWRRQIYNAILYASKFDSVCAMTSGCNVPTSILNENINSLSKYAKLSVFGSSLIISNLHGVHSVEIMDLDGKRVAYGKGNTSYSFTDLNPNTLYVIAFSTDKGGVSRLVMVP
jgi:hypothetical protein